MGIWFANLENKYITENTTFQEGYKNIAYSVQNLSQRKKVPKPISVIHCSVQQLLLLVILLSSDCQLF